jgi:hypothetical protein
MSKLNICVDSLDFVDTLFYELFHTKLNDLICFLINKGKDTYRLDKDNLINICVDSLKEITEDIKKLQLSDTEVDAFNVQIKDKTLTRDGIKSYHSSRVNYLARLLSYDIIPINDHKGDCEYEDISLLT